MVYVAEVDDAKALLYGAKVNHFMFEDDGMRMWRYFNVGEGIFVSGIKIIRGFSKTEAGAQSKTDSKQRSERIEKLDVL